MATSAYRRYYRVTHIGPFPLLKSPNGSSYRIRVRIAFYAGGSATIVGV